MYSLSWSKQHTRSELCTLGADLEFCCRAKPYNRQLKNFPKFVQKDIYFENDLAVIAHARHPDRAAFQTQSKKKKKRVSDPNLFQLSLLRGDQYLPVQTPQWPRSCCTLRNSFQKFVAALSPAAVQSCRTILVTAPLSAVSCVSNAADRFWWTCD